MFHQKRNENEKAKVVTVEMPDDITPEEQEMLKSALDLAMARIKKSDGLPDIKRVAEALLRESPECLESDDD